MAGAQVEVLLIGCGKMGGALLAGWLADTTVAGVTIIDPVLPADAFAGERRVRIGRQPADVPADYRPDAVVIAVKPQMMAALAEYRAVIDRGAVVLSIAAGKTIASFVTLFGTGTAIVRAMPNTPAAIGRGISVAIANAAVTPAMFALCDRLLQAGGLVEWVQDESLIDAVTATSGGGPAYVFLLIEALASAGEAAGLPPALAMTLARTTVCGAGELAHRSTETPDQLRRNVTSPNGTTEAALAILMGEGGFADLMTRAVEAATRRSRELAQ